MQEKTVAHTPINNDQFRICVRVNAGNPPCDRLNCGATRDVNEDTQILVRCLTAKPTA